MEYEQHFQRYTLLYPALKSIFHSMASPCTPPACANVTSVNPVSANGK